MQVVSRHWPLIEADLHECYGFDTGEPGALTRRSWAWLETRVRGLVSRPPTVVSRADGSGFYLPSTRIGLQLQPPPQQEGT